jgi:PIN domain nuclease of toxin-antitoxin system
MTETMTYPLRLPRSIKKAVEQQSREDGTSINQFVATAVAEKLSALRAAEFFAGRRERADFKAFDKLMNTLIVSAASAWEIAIKVRLGKFPTGTDLAADFSGLIEREGFQLLAISAEHAIRAGLLPGPHKDPFDRMLIAQAQAENIPIISNEASFESYGLRRLW